MKEISIQNNVFPVSIQRSFNCYSALIYGGVVDNHFSFNFASMFDSFQR